MSNVADLAIVAVESRIHELEQNIKRDWKELEEQKQLLIRFEQGKKEGLGQ